MANKDSSKIPVEITDNNKYSQNSDWNCRIILRIPIRIPDGFVF